MKDYYIHKVKKTFRGMVDVRSNLATKAVQENKSVKVILHGAIMTLTPAQLRSPLSISKKEWVSMYDKDENGNPQSYKLLSYSWKPDLEKGEVIEEKSPETLDDVVQEMLEATLLGVTRYASTKDIEHLNQASKHIQSLINHELGNNRKP